MRQLIWEIHVYQKWLSALGREPSREEVEELDLTTFASERRLDEADMSRGAGASVVGESSTAEKVDEVLPFIVSEALPVVPGKLVKRILQGEFTDMAELLKDNVEAERRRLLSGETRSGQRNGRREVPDFESWLQCFSAYASVICSKFPHKARELWAYQAFMITEHRKCGGRGWSLYDSAFRQQIASLEAADFAKVNQSLYSTTFLAYGGRGQFCTRCLMADHSQEDCALHPGRDVPVVRLRDTASTPARREDPEWRRRRARRGACFAFNDGRCAAPPLPIRACVLNLWRQPQTDCMSRTCTRSAARERDTEWTESRWMKERRSRAV